MADASTTLQSSEMAVKYISRFNSMKSARKNWDLRWDELARYISPHRGNILTKYTPGQDINFNLYDTTAEEANGICGAGLVTHIVPAGEKWFHFDPKNKYASSAIREWLDEVSEIALDAIYTSNFYVGIHEVFLDSPRFGTSALYLEKGKRNFLNFIQVPVGTFSIMEDAEGYVDTIAREWKWSARQAQEYWGDDKLGPQLKDALRNGQKDMNSADRQFTFVHFVEPRREVVYRGDEVAPWMRPIRSLYLCIEDQCIIEEGGYYEMPYFVNRFLRSNNEVYGRGPGMQALAEIKLVNAMERDILTAIEKQVSPPWLAPDDTSSAIDGRPNGITYWDTSNPANKPEQLTLKNNIDLGEQKTEQKRQRIRKAFYNDLFQMLSNWEEQKREKTAYEVQQMVAEKLVLFSPVFARITQEILNPMLECVVSMLARNGKLPPPPDGLMDGEGEYQIVYTSKIALAIKAVENQSFATMLSLIEQAAQIDPSARYVMKIQEGLTRVARNVGTPSKLLRSQREIDELVQADMQRQQAQEQLMAAQAASQSAKNLGPEAQRKIVDQMPAATSAMS